MRRISLATVEGVWHADAERAYDLSIPLEFDGSQPNLFGAPVATGAALRSGEFVGDVGLGGSCNCSQYHLTPHCNGTHTECVGHVTRQRVSVREVHRAGLELALLLSITPTPASQSRESTDPAPRQDDLLITAEALAAAWRPWGPALVSALAIRTLPNDPGKLSRRYESDPPPPYLTRQAVELIVASGVEHLLLDVPSLDRIHDQGLLTGHRIFWGLQPGGTDVTAARRAEATVTELIFAPDSIPEGRYLLDLQIAPFAADAAPSRPLLFPVIEA